MTDPDDQRLYESLERSNERLALKSGPSHGVDKFEDSFYHGPEAPGENWEMVGQGPHGGKIWRHKPDAQKVGIVGKLLGRKGEVAEDSTPNRATGQKEIAERMKKSPGYTALASRIDKESDGAYAYLSHQAGVSPDQYKAKVAEKAQNLVNNLDVYMRIKSPDIMSAILHGGRFKNQHETGFATGGAYDPKTRAKVEQESMGTAADTLAPSRAMYAYMSAKDFEYPANGKADTADNYGGIIVKFKPHVKERATVTFGDSWNLKSTNEGQASPISAVSHRSVSAGDLQSVGGHGVLDSYDAYVGKKMSYIEAQVHDGLSTSDVAEVRFPKSFVPPQAMQDQLKKRGITWSQY